MMTSDQFFRLEKDNPHDHIRWFNKITSTIKYKDVPNSAIKLRLFPFSLAGAACQWLEKEPSRFIHTWEDLVSKFINEFFPPSRTTNLRNEISNFQQWFDESFHEAWDRYKDLLRACLHHSFTELHQLDTFYNALNPADQDSLNVAAGGNLLERGTQDVLTIIKNKSKVRNSQNKSIVSQVKSCDANSNYSFEIAKRTHAVNQQTSVVNTAMMAILKQFQATPPPAFVKAVEEICVTCDGAHPYYQCLAAVGNIFPELRDNIQGYVSAAAVNYNQGNSVYLPPEQSYQAPTQQNQIIPLNELEKVKRMNEANMKAMQTQINIVKNELRNETKNSIQASLSNQTNEIKNMVASLFQMNTASTSGSGSLPSNTVSNPKEEDERVEETLTDLDLSKYTIKVPPPLVQKYKPLSQRDYVVHQRDPLHPNISNPSRMLKQKHQEKDKRLSSRSYPKNLKTLGNFPFRMVSCKALAELGASINLMPLSVWKKLGLPELISTRMNLELANRAICTPAGIARDVFVLVGKFTFPADFFIVDYKSDPRVPLILGRPFLRTAHALIEVHGEEMILRDGDERLTLNKKHDTSSYSNQPQKESINLINLFNNPSEDFLKDLFSNQPSGNPTFLSHPELTSSKFKMISLMQREFDVEFDLKEIEFLLHQDIDSSLKDSIDQSNLANPADNFVDVIPELFTDEHALDYSSPLISDEYDDDFLKVESDTENVYDDPFDSKREKIKESKLLIGELDLPCDFLLPSEYDSFISQEFSKVDSLPSTNNEDKVFNPRILIQENPFEIITRAVQDKKLAISNISLILEDFDPPLYEPLFFKEVPSAAKQKLMLLDSAAKRRLMLLSQVNAANVILMMSRPS
nr:reverse transcriptase domain-containing protein [Tanacetum cinerariifolium]